MAKIFQLELFIKEMSVWKLPSQCKESDETCVEVTLFDIKDVPMKKEAFDDNITMNRGQNFLFTLYETPTAKQKMFFNIFKKTRKMAKRFLGTGQIPINETFSDVFLRTFHDDHKNDLSRQIPQHRPPISKLTKDVYPIIDANSKQCGIVCILMRLTSFGNFSAHQIHLHQNHKEIIIQNTPNTALYERVPLDVLRNGSRAYFGYISPFPNNSARSNLIYDRRGMNDFSIQCNENDVLLQNSNTDNDENNPTLAADVEVTKKS